MSRVLLPDTEWRTALPALLRAAEQGATIVARKESQRQAAHAVAKRLGRKDLSFIVEVPPREPLKWYFVSKRGPDIYEVDLLNDDGSTALDDEGQGKTGQVRPDTTELVIAGEPIPRPVIEAAKQRVEGHGQNVDAEGRLLDVWGRPVAA